MADLENYTEMNVSETEENVNDNGSATEATGTEKKKFGAGEYAVLASAIVGAGTMAWAAFKFVKTQVVAGKNYLKRQREAKKAASEDQVTEKSPANEQSETNEKKDG